VDKPEIDMWSRHENTRGPITRRHVSKRDEDTRADKIMTRGVMLVRHVALC
jgi:hypothetical protein